MAANDHVVQPPAGAETAKPLERLSLAELQPWGEVAGAGLLSFTNHNDVARHIAAVGLGVAAIVQDVASGANRVSTPQIARYLKLNETLVQGVLSRTAGIGVDLERSKTMSSLS